MTTHIAKAIQYATTETWRPAVSTRIKVSDPHLDVLSRICCYLSAQNEKETDTSFILDKNLIASVIPENEINRVLRKMTVLSIITPMKPWNANRYVYNINDNTTMANTEQAKIEPLTEIVASLPPEFPMNAVKLRKHLNENGHSKTRISTLVSAGLLVKTKESHIFKYELPINEITKNGVDLELSVTDFNTIKREAHAYRIRTTSYIRKVLAGEINPLANITFKSNAANIAACA